MSRFLLTEIPNEGFPGIYADLSGIPKEELIGKTAKRQNELIAGRLLLQLALRGEGCSRLQDLKPYSLERITGLIDKPIALNIVYSDKGKPSFSDKEQKFSLSHSGKYCFLAISDGGSDIGADIEKINPLKNLDLAKRFFHEDEYKELVNLNYSLQNREFYRLWTRKEAYGKCIGEGIPAIVGRKVLNADNFEFDDYCLAVYEEQT
ncbi:MAG: 4'-phosphopantetheinyl transferase superfamily protein [Acetatifactor sp.]|nr:4'-phosphopantetheinyl transferase superfamily protein [Acetatifactor sp.]